jgi:rhodanese-related sulfurtransferase
MTYNQPKHQDYHVPGVRHIGPQYVYGLIKGSDTILVDVREIEETLAESPGPTSGMVQIPLSEFENRLGELPVEKTLLIMCAHGVRSVQVCAWLTHNGFEKVLNVDGGFEVLKRL